MTGYVVRPAGPVDRTVVEEIVRQAYAPWQATLGVRPRPLDADYAELIDHGRVYVADSDDGPRGVIVIIPEDNAMLIENVAVAPDAQGSGVGGLLLRFAESLATDEGLSGVRLYTFDLMTTNIDWYERAGYHRTSVEKVPAGHLVHLRKDLGP